MFAKGKMNIVFVLGFVLVASAFASVPNPGECESSVDLNAEGVCSPVYSSFQKMESTLQTDLKQYASQLVDNSFHFLVMSSAFKKHDMDRPGFAKLYRKISDKAWEDAIDLIKYQSRRGSFGNLVKPTVVEANYTKALEGEELDSLRFALDYEKAMAKEAHKIHRKVSHAHSNENSHHLYDPDTAHYLDEKLIEYQSGVIRDLAGYVHNLKHFTGDKVNADLGNHLFDEYLEKAL